MKFAQAKWIKPNYRFQRLYRRGKFYNLREISIYYQARRDTEIHLAVSVARKIRGAVGRNRAKRRLREYLYSYDGFFKPGFDLVLMARPGLLEADFHRLKSDLTKAMVKLDLICLPDQSSLPDQARLQEVEPDNPLEIDSDCGQDPDA